MQGFSGNTGVHVFVIRKRHFQIYMYIQERITDAFPAFMFGSEQ